LKKLLTTYLICDVIAVILKEDLEEDGNCPILFGVLEERA
jgi:hypothetical protein